MFTRSLLLGLVLTSASATAFAGSKGSSPLDDAKAKCKELIANKQLKPQAVQLVCDEVSYVWRAKDANIRTLPNFRTVTASLSIEKLGVVLGHDSFSLPGDDTKFNCQQLVKVKRHIGSIQETVSCDNIDSISDLSSYCANMLGDRAKIDPSLIKETMTAEIQDFCPAQAQAKGKETVPAKNAKGGMQPFPYCSANNGMGYGASWEQDGLVLSKDNADFSEGSICIVNR